MNADTYQGGHIASAVNGGNSMNELYSQFDDWLEYTVGHMAEEYIKHD